MLSRLELARKIAVEAGELTLRYFYDLAHLAVERKADESPVTVADRETELLLRKRIEEQFPEDAVFGEEFPPKSGSSGYQWFLDPIDGTKSFIHGVPLYSTLIGISFSRAAVMPPESVAGVIALPALHELIWAGKEQGAWYETQRFTEPQRARVSQCRNISEALFLTSEVKTFNKTNRTAAYKNLERSTRLARTWGDAYGYAMVATGRADIMVDPALSDWDAGPLQIILEEAGGRFTDWQGNATIFGKEGIGTNGLLHDAVLEIISRREN
ncbi:MAG: inositol monophosphatase family protein [Planctomycetaceae bacterium]|jgi:histidinol phosphatase-like enzyme (inositol monophosphatase family)|nr:inositol monophosphatase family protein [Planctomycetaceae bacterium]